MRIELTRRQLDFIKADCFEVLFGGSAGGGKSYGQVIDAFVFAMKYPRSRQLVLRRSRPELEKTLVRTALALYPKDLYSYGASNHTGLFANGSTLEFGYCEHDNDVYRYQSAEYDVIRFDELTHFTEHMYTYLISRVRGANGYPKQLKSTTNPGGVGHEWVKKRFIDLGAADTPHETGAGARIFLPSALRDNVFLRSADGGYEKRLGALDERDRLSLALGEWNLDEGRYFDEWRSEVHVVAPYELPRDSPRYFCMDYGLDMLAGLWISLDSNGRAVVYRELYEPNLIISAAAQKIGELCEDENICEFLAPPDLWNRRQESGMSAADIFASCGVSLCKAPANRVSGWLALKELLRIRKDGDGREYAGLCVFSCCRNLIRTLPALSRDEHNPSDCAVLPHELTHAPDALRYFASAHACELTDSSEQTVYDGPLQRLTEYFQ